MDAHTGPAVRRAAPIALTLLLGLLVLLSPHQVRSQDQAKPVLKDGVEFSDCRVCHGPKTGLPADHIAPTDPAFANCRECHKGESDLRGKLPLAHLHRMGGLECADCHGRTDPPKALTQKDCLGCHGRYEELIAATKKEEPNPHNSHYREMLECDACHHAHAKSENYCASCHDWKLRVP